MTIGHSWVSDRLKPCRSTARCSVAASLERMGPGMREREHGRGDHERHRQELDLLAAERDDHRRHEDQPVEAAREVAAGDHPGEAHAPSSSDVARFEHAHLHRGRPLGRAGRELVRRVREPAARPQDARIERAPVDRHRQPGAEHGRGAGGALRIEVARAQLRPPAPDRQQRDVEIRLELGHPLEQVGVAGEVDRAAAPQDEAERLHPRPAERTPAPSWTAGVAATSTSSTQADSPGASSSTRAKPALRSTPPPPRGTISRSPRSSLRSDGPVEVVEVQVRDQHRGEVVGHLRRR